jgi:hypothetical protein
MRAPVWESAPRTLRPTAPSSECLLPSLPMRSCSCGISSVARDRIHTYCLRGQPCHGGNRTIRYLRAPRQDPGRGRLPVSQRQRNLYPPDAASRSAQSDQLKRKASGRLFQIPPSRSTALLYLWCFAGARPAGRQGGVCGPDAPLRPTRSERGRRTMSNPCAASPLEASAAITVLRRNSGIGGLEDYAKLSR